MKNLARVLFSFYFAASMSLAQAQTMQGGGGTAGGGGGTVTTITAGTNITLSSGATCTTTCTINSSAGGGNTTITPTTGNTVGDIVTMSNTTTTVTDSGIKPGTGVGTALAVDVGTAGAFVTNGGALGTPSSGVGTNLTGTAAGLTAGNVTTNANLTGPVTSVGNATSLSLTTRTRSFSIPFGDTTGSALTSGSIVYFNVPYAGTIASWGIEVDAGTVTFDIWKIATGTAIPTVTNTITASALPALSTGTAIHSTTLTGWTTSVTAYDIFAVQLKTVATAKYANLDLEIDQ